MSAVSVLQNAAQSTGLFGELAESDFLFRPLLLVVMLSVVGGFAGVIVNLRRSEFNVEAMVHSVFPGIVGGALFYGIDGIVPGASIAAAIAVIGLVFLARFSHHRGAESEAGTACIMAGLYAVGIIISLKRRDKSGQLEALMFGRLLEVTPTQFVEAMIICLAGAIALALTFRSQVFVAFDPSGASATGVSTFAVDIILNVVIAAVVVSGAQAIGVLLVIGLIIIPGATARLVASSIPAMVVISTLTGLIGAIAGMLAVVGLVSRPVSAQATVTLSIALLYFVALIYRVARTKLTRV